MPRAKLPKRTPAADAAHRPADDRPAWYRPPGGFGGGAPKALDFAPGNVQRLDSGYRSPRVYGDVARALVAGLVDQRPDLAAHPEALASWGDAEARAALLRSHLDAVGMLDETNAPRESLLRQLDRFERRAAAARERLGLDPRSEAELALLRAKALREGQLLPQVNLDALVEQGRELLARGTNARHSGEELDPVRAALERVRAEAQHSETEAQPAAAPGSDTRTIPARLDPTREETAP